MRPQCAAGVFASRCRVVVEVSLLMVLRFCLVQCEADEWNIFHQLFPVPSGRWCVCMLNCWFSSIDVFAQTTTTTCGCVADEGKYTIIYFQYHEDFGCVCTLNDWFSCYDGLRRQPQLFPVQVEGQGSQCKRCSSTGTVRGLMGRLFWAVCTGTRPGVPPPSGRRRGGGDTGSLLPGVLPPN